MKQATRLVLAATVAGVVLMTQGSTLVSAQTAAERQAERQAQVEQLKQEREEKKAQLQEKKTESLEQRCSLSTQRIELWTSRYANNETRLQNIADKSKEITDKVIAKAKEAGKDTTELESVVAVFEGKVDAAMAEYDVLIAKLNDTKQYACGESEGAYRESLNAARQQSLTTREATLDARVYYQQSVRPAVQALLQQ